VRKFRHVWEFCLRFRANATITLLDPTSGWHDRVMTVIKINAITVPADSGDELAKRFAARAGAVDDQDGFEGFELLRPTDDRHTWLVMTRWRDDDAFNAWLSSPAFGHGHAQARAAGDQAAPDGHPHGGAHDNPHGGGEQSRVGVNSELWSFDIASGSPGKS
jgi:heme-degrading monooxygenase HmoA